MAKENDPIEEQEQSQEVPANEDDFGGNGVDCPFMSEQEERELVAEATSRVITDADRARSKAESEQLSRINAARRRIREQEAAEDAKNAGNE